MDLTRYVDDLQHRLASAADAAGQDARDLAERLAAPLDAAVRLVLLDALTAAAGEISAEIAPGSVDVRLRSGGPEFVVEAPGVRPEPASVPSRALVPPAAAAVPAPPELDAGSTTRTTLRLPDHLKTQVELAAAREGLSVNTWLVRAVSAALEQPTDLPAAQARAEPRGGTRLTGWVR